MILKKGGGFKRIKNLVLFKLLLKLINNFYSLNQTSGDLSPMSFLVGIVMTFVWVNYGILIGRNIHKYTLYFILENGE